MLRHVVEEDSERRHWTRPFRWLTAVAVSLWVAVGGADILRADEGSDDTDSVPGIATDTTAQLAPALEAFDSEELDGEARRLAKRAARRYFGLVRYCELGREQTDNRGLEFHSWNSTCERLFAQVDLGPIRRAYLSALDPSSQLVLTSPKTELPGLPDERRRMNVLAAVRDGRLLPLYIAPGSPIYGFSRAPDGDHVAIVRLPPLYLPPSETGPEKSYVRDIHLSILDLSTLRVRHRRLARGSEASVKLTWSDDGDTLFTRVSVESTEKAGSGSPSDYRCPVGGSSCSPVEGRTATPLVELFNRRREGVHVTPSHTFRLGPFGDAIVREVRAQPRAGSLLHASIEVGPEGRWVAWETIQSGDDDHLRRVGEVYLWLLDRKTGERRKINTSRALHHARWTDHTDDQPRLLYEGGIRPVRSFNKRYTDKHGPHRTYDEDEQTFASHLLQKKGFFDVDLWRLPTERYNPETDASNRWMKGPPVRLGAPVAAGSREPIRVPE